MSAAGGPSKKTIYIDVDEEITGIIDKVKTSSDSIIALVLPKRATMLQSVVNMKLLKRSADQSEKNVVLITSEPSLMPLAGAAGLHVAPNLQTRPYLPSATGTNPPSPEPDMDQPDLDDIDPTTPIGNLTDAKLSDQDKPIEIDNRSRELKIDPKLAAPGAGKLGKKDKAPKDKSKKVPNFNKFRVLLFGGIALLILLLVGLYWALAIAPKAKITLRTESKEVQVDARFKADTEADELDVESSTLPAINEELKKTESEKAPATGQKDNGTKATGSVTLRNCTDNQVTIPAGTGISSGNLTFITQSTIRLDEGDFSSPSSGSQCRSSGDHVEKVGVIAQNNGDQYNLSSRSYTVSGFSGVTAQGEQMSGGTSKIVKTVSAADLETAKKKITAKQNAVVEEIKEKLKSDGYIALVDTFSNGNPNFTSSPAVGSESADVTVTADITYTMLGVKEDDLKKIVEEQSKEDIDTSKQTILSYGFDDASYEVGRKTGSITNIDMKTTLVAGPEINQEDMKRELAGKKRGDSENILKERPGITEAKVETSPFWVSKVPKKASKVNFIIEQADGKPISQ